MASSSDAGEHLRSAIQVRDLQERGTGCAENIAFSVQGHGWPLGCQCANQKGAPSQDILLARARKLS